ncbi:aminoglycoside phosphotransferase family protein [Sporosarcina sp. ANT_H38]|uniref:aminoglycoside phosphotransferase family protein n=1 Tax=Sporosarcina sp. ANT_H38 TaxID=2597358 RepID=UPI0011F0DC57|nr:aminoglycoside phosphotransferase family protein [Sporosarcina sp. ANT_H38]KAA0965754.1 aminoglycoside phosphotransferase family protein [Sporosarcina sp. ANT_H38]
MGFTDIPFLKNSSSYKLINKGFSTDVKWCVDEKYLLRISPTIDVKQLEEQAFLTNAVHAIDPRIPYVYEVALHKGHAYMILDYIAGENGEIVLSTRSDALQYKIGQQVGQTLRNMHSIPAPIDSPTWEERWTRRVELLSPRYEKIAGQNGRYLRVLSFVQGHLHLLKGRPSHIQHYDFHPGNILIQDDQFTGLIDMQKITYGDAVNEFYKMEYFNVPVSITYSRGVLDGYHNNNPIPKNFWELHRLYAAIHILSAEVWSNEIALNQQEKFKKYTVFTMDQFDDFKLLIPKWYARGTDD